MSPSIPSIFPGGTNSAAFVEARGWGPTIGIKQSLVLFCATFPSIKQLLNEVELDEELLRQRFVLSAEAEG